MCDTEHDTEIEIVEWDFTQMVEDFGCEYLMDCDPDNEPFSMDDFNDFEIDAYEAVKRVFFGGDRDGGPFNPNRDWFRYDGYGNLESIYDVNEYMTDIIDEDSFKKWCIDNGYYEVE